MQDWIDTLASEYGWEKDYILNSVYPEEIEIYRDKIEKRQAYADLRQIQCQNATKETVESLKRTLGMSWEYKRADIGTMKKLAGKGLSSKPTRKGKR